MSTPHYVSLGGLSVAPVLAELAASQVLPGTGVSPETFWSSLGQLVAEGSPLNGSSNAAEIQAVTGTVGAFQLKTDASDPALLVSLVPGSYTIHISGRLGAAGNALAEIYAVP